MKKRNTYYHEVFGRPAVLKQVFLATFLGLSYYFRVPIEIITRSNMGERYFNLLLTITIGLALLVVPTLFATNYMGDIDYRVLFGRYGTWYAYTFFYLYCGFLRWREIRNNPSAWDLKRFSLAPGDPHRLLYRFRVRKENQNQRFMATIIEPGVFLVAGLLLTLLLQPIGMVLIVCAVVYSLGYTAAFYISDQYVLDKIDEMICNEDMYDIFVNDIPSQRGFEFHAKRPKDKDSRQKLYEDYIDVDYEVDEEPQEVK